MSESSRATGDGASSASATRDGDDDDDDDEKDANSNDTRHNRFDRSRSSSPSEANSPPPPTLVKRPRGRPRGRPPLHPRAGPPPLTLVGAIRSGRPRGRARGSRGRGRGRVGRPPLSFRPVTLTRGGRRGRRPGSGRGLSRGLGRGLGRGLVRGSGLGRGTAIRKPNSSLLTGISIERKSTFKKIQLNEQNYKSSDQSADLDSSEASGSETKDNKDHLNGVTILERTSNGTEEKSIHKFSKPMDMKDYWRPPTDVKFLLDNVMITDVTMDEGEGLSITIRESTSDVGFFHERDEGKDAEEQKPASS